jgi:predicted phosphodiesterase
MLRTGLISDTFRIPRLPAYVIHELSQLNIELNASGVNVVVYGLSHKPSIEKRADVLFVNPGSAGPRRFRLPITIAELIVDGNAVSARIVQLETETQNSI